MTSVEQIIPADIVLNAMVMYLTNRLSLQSRTSGIWEASLSISKDFLKDKLNLSYTFGNKDYISVKKTRKKRISDDQMNMDSNSKSF